MDTPRPATWSSLTVHNLFAEALDVILSRLFLLHGDGPADPFVPCERREVIPRLTYLFGRQQGFPHVRRDCMNDTGGETICHSIMIANFEVEDMKSFEMRTVRSISFRGTIQIMAGHRIYSMSFGNVYPLYVAKAERKGRTKSEVDTVIRWFTGYAQKELNAEIKKGTDFETFLKNAPKLNPLRRLITGVVCGIRVEDIKEPLMQEIRYMDKLIDELAKGKAMEKILRKG
jgi:hypothetical protein